MKKSMCCNADLIYLGKNNHPNIKALNLTPMYIYCCSECGNLEWSIGEKSKVKYKWYNYDKDKLKDLLNGKIIGS